MPEMRDIPGFNGWYAVTDDGQVWSHRRHRFLPPQPRKVGYFYVWLQDGPERENRRQYLIHRLVAKTFILNLENKPEVNHIDGDKTNNCVANLEWVTHRENHIHAGKMGFKSGKKTYSPHRAADKDTGAHFPLRPDQLHLLDGLRLMVDTVRAQVPTKDRLRVAAMRE